jgi:DNA-binding transcriptional ArsR family regulator
MKRWTIIFKALGNINRLKILKLLSHGESLSVGDIAAKMKISVKGASQHLILLHNLDVLEAMGMKGHVYYSMNPNMPKDFKQILHACFKLS